MKVIFIREFGTGAIGAKIGDIREVIRKKEPDKWNDYVRYLIRIPGLLGSINVPERFVREVAETT